MKKSNFLKVNPFVVFLFCLMLYPPTLKVFPAFSYVITVVIPALYLLINHKMLKKIIVECKQKKTILFASLLLFMSLLIPVLYNTNDFSYLYSTSYIFRKLLVYVFLISVIVKRHGYKEAGYYFMYYFALAHLIYVIGTLILVLIPPIQNAWFSIMSKNAINESIFESYGYTFRIGWQGFSGFRLTLYCTLSIIFALYITWGATEKKIKTLNSILLILGCILGNMFYGRIGIIISVIIGIIAFFIWGKNRIKRTIIVILISLAGVVSFNYLKEIPVFREWSVWMSTPLTNFASTGDFDNASFDTLIEMSQIELTDKTLLVGDGRYSDGTAYYRNTDVGYMRNILFWGIMGGIISYGATLYSMIELNKISRVILAQLLIVFCIFEFKGAVYYEFIPLTFALDAIFEVANGGKNTLREGDEE